MIPDKEFKNTTKMTTQYMKLDNINAFNFVRITLIFITNFSRAVNLKERKTVL